MSYNAVPPPGGSAKPKFDMAAMKAKIQAKAAALRAGEAPPAATKRPADEDTDNVPASKRMAQEPTMAPPGLAAPPGLLATPGGMPPPATAPGVAIVSAVMTTPLPDGQLNEELLVPNEYVGRIIGKMGETINRLQAESKCRIQVTPINGLAKRSISLTGTPETIELAKSLINKIIEEQAQSSGDAALGASQCMESIDIPKERVGMVIGRGGDTIKRLQDESGARLQMIQDGDFQHSELKPLRISGGADEVAKAVRLVRQLIFDEEEDGSTVAIVPKLCDSRGIQAPSSGSIALNLEYYASKTVRINVPRFAVGTIIGRGGDTIKRIQAESGARVQFEQEGFSNSSDDFRVCIVTGTQDMVGVAENRVNGLISDAQQRENTGTPGAALSAPPTGSAPLPGLPGGPPSSFVAPGGGSGYGPPPGGGSEYGPPAGQITERLSVTARLCGLVIGRGGESIKEIQQRSGANIKLDREHPPDPVEKDFIIIGSPEQVQSAKDMIAAKLEEQRNRRNSNPGGGFRPPMNNNGPPPMGYGGPGGHPPYGGPPPGHYGGPPQHGYGGPHGGYMGPPHGGGGYGGPPPHGGGYGGPPPGGGYGGYGGPPPGGGGGYGGYGGMQMGPQNGGAAQAHSNAAQPAEPQVQQQQQQQQPPGATAATSAGTATGAAVAPGATANEEPAGEYPSHEMYLANKEWYNAQGYYGVDPTKQPQQPQQPQPDNAAQWAAYYASGGGGGAQ